MFVWFFERLMLFIGCVSCPCFLFVVFEGARVEFMFPRGLVFFAGYCGIEERVVLVGIHSGRACGCVV